MRTLPIGLVLAGLALSGCAATASSTPATATSHAATPAATASGVVHDGGAAAVHGGPAMWLVHGTFRAGGTGGRPLSGMVVFHDNATGNSVNVSVGPSGTFSFGLAAGTYTATGRASGAGQPCAPVAVTVKAGQGTQLSLVCHTV